MSKSIIKQIGELILGPAPINKIPPREDLEIHVTHKDLEGLRNHYPKKIRQIEQVMAEKDAKISRIEKDLQQYKGQEENRKKEWEEQQLISIAKEHKSLRKIRNLRFIFKTPLKICVTCEDNFPFMGRGDYAGKSFPFLRGFRLEHTEYGPFVYFLLTKTSKPVDKQYMSLPVTYLFNLWNVIEDSKNLVTSMKMNGCIKLHIRSDGKPLPTRISIPADTNVAQFSADMRNMMNIDILRLKKDGELSDEAFKIIVGLYDKTNQLSYELDQAQQIAQEAIWDKTDAAARAKVAEGMQEKMPSMLSVALGKLDKSMEQLLMYKSSEQESEIRALLSEMLAKRLFNKIEEQVEKAAGTITEDKKQRVKEEIKRDADDIVSM